MRLPSFLCCTGVAAAQDKIKKHFYQAQASAQVRMITFFSRALKGAV